MSEPVKLAAILPEVLRDIEGRCERYRMSLAGGQENPELRLSPDKVQHGEGVLDALAGFHEGKKRMWRAKRPTRARSEYVEAARAGNLFENGT